MKSTSAIVAISSLLAGGVASAAAAPSSPSLSVSLPKSKSEAVAVTQIRSQRTKRLRNHHNGYRSTASGSMSRRRRLQLFQISPAPPPPSTINTTIATTSGTVTPPPTAAGKPSGIFDTGGITSTFTPSESPSSSSTSRKSTFPTTSTPLLYSMNIIDGFSYGLSVGSMVPSASPSMIYVETYLPTPMSIDLLPLPPDLFLPSLSLQTSIPTYTVSIPESLSPTSMSWDLFPADDFSLSIPTQNPTFSPTTSPSMLAPVPPPSVPRPSITTPVVETKCEFCTEISMDESAIIPFSDETTCGMAKEIVVQLDSTSEDCELARKAESICCPKTLAPSTTLPIMTTPAPTISWPPTDAPTAPPSSGRSVGLTNWTLRVVVSSCLVSYWVAILGLP